MSDPLADVIRAAIAPRHPVPFWLPVMLADAVRAHIAALLDAEEARWNDEEVWQDGDAADVFTHLRTTLLGDSSG